VWRIGETATGFNTAIAAASVRSGGPWRPGRFDPSAIA
jgi:hypothetical protein